MLAEELVMGLLIALLCGWGFVYQRWFLEETSKGQWLARRLGEEKALWVLRVLFALGTAFGLLLAAGVVTPVQW